MNPTYMLPLPLYAHLSAYADPFAYAPLAIMAVSRMIFGRLPVIAVTLSLCTFGLSAALCLPVAPAETLSIGASRNLTLPLNIE